MKKLLVSLFLFSLVGVINAQGKLYLQNYSVYDLQMRLEAQHITNCTPEIIGSLSFPASTQDIIENYNDSPPFAMSWGVLLPGASSAITQPVPGSGLLTTLSSITQWRYCWFKTFYAGTITATNDVDFTMADPNNLPCSFTGTDYIDGNLTDAFWFTIPSMNATYLVIQ